MSSFRVRSGRFVNLTGIVHSRGKPRPSGRGRIGAPGMGASWGCEALSGLTGPAMAGSALPEAERVLTFCTKESPRTEKASERKTKRPGKGGVD